MSGVKEYNSNVKKRAKPSPKKASGAKSVKRQIRAKKQAEKPVKKVVVITSSKGKPKKEGDLEKEAGRNGKPPKVAVREYKVLTNPLKLITRHDDLPSKDLSAKVGALMRVGATPDVACRSMGIRREQFEKWLKLGLEDLAIGNETGLCAIFVRTLDIADAQDEVSDLYLITHGAKHWSALAWKRERKTPQRWGQKVQATLALDELLKGKDPDTLKPLVDYHTGAEMLAILEEHGYLGGGLIEGQVEEVSG